MLLLITIRLTDSLDLWTHSLFYAPLPIVRLYLWELLLRICICELLTPTSAVPFDGLFTIVHLD